VAASPGSHRPDLGELPSWPDQAGLSAALLPVPGGGRRDGGSASPLPKSTILPRIFPRNMLERRTGRPEGTPPTKLRSQAADDKESRGPGFHPLIVGAECPACSVFSLRSRSLRIRSSRKSLTVSPAAAASSSIQVRNVSSSLKVSTTLDLVPFNSLAMLGFPSNPCSSSFLPGVRHGLPHRGSVNPFEGYAIGARPPDAGCPDRDAGRPAQAIHRADDPAPRRFDPDPEQGAKPRAAGEGGEGPPLELGCCRTADN